MLFDRKNSSAAHKTVRYNFQTMKIIRRVVRRERFVFPQKENVPGTPEIPPVRHPAAQFFGNVAVGTGLFLRLNIGIIDCILKQDQSEKQRMKNNISNFDEYQRTYRQSVETPEVFWETIANEFVWRKKWNEVVSWDFHAADVKWFSGGKLNITENCIDRHLPQRARQTAILWEPNNPEEEARSITYQELQEQVGKVGNMLRNFGVKKGDRVCIYMPMVPELAFAVLGCARIGAVHSVIFAGFSAGSIADRINDSGCKLILTADGAFRGEKKTDLKAIIDEALPRCPTIEKAIVFERIKSNPPMKPGRDVWWHEAMANVSASCAAEEMDAEDLLFILYTSGSTGKPKGMVHTCGGYMVFVNYTFRTAFQYDASLSNDGQHPAGGVYWCTADVGWITGGLFKGRRRRAWGGRKRN